MTYAETLDYLYQSLPIFQRVGASAYKGDLKNTLALCEALGNPHRKFKSVHVGGTNGKGSSSHMIASVLQSAGYKTGLHTSPHLKEFTERIRINGVEVDKEFVVDFVQRLRPVLESIQPSFFETTVVMAFDYFAYQEVDVAVIEVGLGGRLDSTNVIQPMVSLITNIGFDHMDILGETLPKIALEKAGIIKPLVPCVISEHQETVAAVFESKAREVQSPLFFSRDSYQLESGEQGFNVYGHGKLLVERLDCELKGWYQEKNLPGVLTTLDRLRELGFAIPVEALRKGMSEVSSLTGLKGRWQELRKKPLVICDTGHNEPGIREVVRQMESIPYHKLHLVIGFVKDKEINPVLDLFPKDAICYFCQAKIPRALSAHDLAAKAAAVGLKGTVVEDVNDAVQRAMAAASDDDFIFIGGSTFVVAEVNDL